MIYNKDIQSFGKKHRILQQDYDYMYLLPHPQLREYISHYSITFDFISDNYIMMPNYNTSLVITTRNLNINVIGSTTMPYFIGSDTCETFVIIVFQPAGFYALTGIPQDELIDRTIPFESIDPILCKLLSDRVDKAKNINELVMAFDTLFLSNLNMCCHPQLKAIFQNISDCGGNTSLRKLSNEIHYSERHLNRVIQKHVGVSAKYLSRLVRINKALNLLKDCNNNITFVSEAAGFHDSSHFIREFKLLCGITPLEYCNNMSNFYSAIIDFF